MNELGNTPADKNYQPSGISRAEEAALKAYPIKMVSGPIGHEEPKFDINAFGRYMFAEGYEQAEKDINKEMMDRMEKCREMQERALLADHDYDIHFDPALGFDSGSVVVYHKDEIVNQLTVEDLELLHTFLYAVKNNKQGVFTFTRLSNEQYQEVLKRFKGARK